MTEAVSFDELLNMTERLAQELLEFIEAGEDGGSEMTAARALHNEFEEMFSRTDLGWRKMLTESDKPNPLMENL